MIREMEKDGFSWEAVQAINDNLRLIIIDLEKSLDWELTKRETRKINSDLNTTNNYELRHINTYFTLDFPRLDYVFGFIG